ncbi:MAG: cation diffusion facilitator family transporter [Planctomycetota bacterium]|jgi:cation diffusion facilitator family transporter
MTKTEKKAEGNSQIRLVTGVAIGVNLGLSILKTIVGIFAGSVALVADGIHSISDMVTDAVVLFGVHWGSKDADPEHPYGHGRIETFSTGIIALILLAVGLGMIYYAAIDIAKGNVTRFNVAVLVVAAISIVVKELLYRITRKTAVKFHSSVLYANAWHQRSDALSSVAVLIGFTALKFGFRYGDQIAAVAVGIMIALVAVNILAECFRELTEGAVDTETIERIERIIDANEQIHQWHKLRSRMVGREVFLDLHILVDPALDITAAHGISENLEETLHQQIHRPVNIVVHIEPDIPELRK